MKEHEVAILGDRKVIWKTQSRTTVDSTRLKEDDLELYKKYTKTTSNRVFKVK